MGCQHAWFNITPPNSTVPRITTRQRMDQGLEAHPQIDLWGKTFQIPVLECTCGTRNPIVPIQRHPQDVWHAFLGWPKTWQFVVHSCLFLRTQPPYRYRCLPPNATQPRVLPNSHLAPRCSQKLAVLSRWPDNGPSVPCKDGFRWWWSCQGVWEGRRAGEKWGLKAHKWFDWASCAEAWCNYHNWPSQKADMLMRWDDLLIIRWQNLHVWPKLRR